MTSANCRYFNIKFKKNTNGIVVRVRPDSKLEGKLVAMIPSDMDVSLRGYLKETKKSYYQLHSEELPYYLKHKILVISLDKKDTLEVTNSEDTGLPIITEISKSKAYRLKEDASYYGLAQGYCDGNLD